MLLDVALVPSFHTNIAAYDKFHSKRVYWDSEKGRLTQDGQTFCAIERHHGQWTLEFMKPMEKQEEAVFSSRSAQPKQEEASPNIWHQWLGHIQPTTITHLPVLANGAKLVKGPATIECEVCSVSKAHEIVSRRPNPRAVKPYERIHIDLIQMTEAYNGDR